MRALPCVNMWVARGHRSLTLLASHGTMLLRLQSPTLAAKQVWKEKPIRLVQVIAHHYCTHLNEEVWQCMIYDSDKKDARTLPAFTCRSHILVMS